MRKLKLKILACAAVLLLVAACSSQTTIEPQPITKGEVVGGYVVQPQGTLHGQVEQQREIARRQEEELKRQQKEIEDLKRQQYINKRVNEYIDRTQDAQ